jgi:hypothetical protein
MPIKVAQNFDYKGHAPNFERDSFESLIQMRNSNPDWFDNGHISYCQETKTHYVFNRSNPYSEISGYFRTFKGDGSIIDGGSDGGGSIYQGKEAPENTNIIWLDTSEEFSEDEEVSTIESLQTAVRILTSQVNKLNTLSTNGIVAGTVSNSVRVDLADPNNAEKPETGLDNPEDDLLTSTTAPDYSDLEEVKPEYEDAAEPTVPHISIKMGTYEQLQSYIKNFIPGELLWCTNKKRLYIYINGSLVVVGSGTANDDDSGNNEGITDMDAEQILNLVKEQLQNTESIGFVPVGSTEAKYTVKVSKEGTLMCYDKAMDSWAPAAKQNYYFDPENSVNGSGLLINSFYLGGDGDEHSYQPCSHNYVELSNVWMKSKTAEQKDINLNGFYLLYLNPKDKKWRSLPLWGTIKANSTFVIRGKQCSVMDSNTTIIKVKNYDMEWYEQIGTTDPVYETDSNGNVLKDENGNDIIKEESKPIYDLIKFEQEGPNGLSDSSAVFYLAWSDPESPGKFYTMDDKKPLVSHEELHNTSNYLINTNSGNGAVGTAKGYCDLASYNNSIICETEPYVLPSGVHPRDVLFRRWYPLDPVGQSNPDDGVGVHNNIQFLTSTYLNGSNWDDKISISEWTPKASWEGKSMRETRSLFKEDKPNTLTITFGYQASDNSATGGEGAGRGFCWNSVGYYDEYLWIRREGDTDWEKVESFKDGIIYVNDDYRGTNISGNKIYNSNKHNGLLVWPSSIKADNDDNSYVEYFVRQRWESSYGQDMTTHKVVVGGLKAGNYEYKVVRGTDENSSYQSKVRKFTVRADEDIKNFSYVQTTDQQGVTWEEWETWVLTARMMKKNYVKQIEMAIPGPETGVNHLYYVNNEPKYNIKDVNNESVYVSNHASDKVSIMVDGVAQEFTGCTTDITRAKKKNYSIGTIPQDYGFIVNTGDVCYNGSRSNEWLEYFYGQEPLDDREEMLCVGNNDLIPPTMRDIGTGQESPWKVNPAVIDYFYAVDFDAKNPPEFLGKPNSGDSSVPVKFKIPGLYAWNYGEFHFVCLLSEIRTISNKIEVGAGEVTTKNLKESTVNLVWGVKDELRNDSNKNASKIYDTVEGWITKDLLYWKGATTEEIESKYHPAGQTATNMNFDWQKARFDERIVGKCNTCIFFAHEMPFNITSDKNYGNYEKNAEVPRETAKAYLNRFHNFEFQRVFKLWGIPMVMGGHKHTCAMTRPVYDAPDGYNPIIKKMDSSYYGTDEATAKKDKDGNILTIGNYLGENGNADWDQLLNDITIQSDGEHFKLNSSGMFSQPASFRPFVQVTTDEFNALRKNLRDYSTEFYNNSNSSVFLGDDNTEELPTHTYKIYSECGYDDHNHPRCRVEIVDNITAPTYIMCQTSGFKNKSNSDLAASIGLIPWERFYVKGDAIAEQCAPFYTVYNVITRDESGKLLENPRIEVNMYRVSGLYQDSGGPKGGSPAGYWSLAKIYCHGETLEENRAYFVGTENDTAGEAKIERYGGITTIKLSMN